MKKMSNYLFLQAIACTLCFLCSINNSSAQSMTIQLDPSNHNGYNISCFGLSDGSIDLTVTGGITPYTYEWSYDAQANSEDLVNVPANFYHVIVTDANEEQAEAEITLTQPEQLRMDLSVYRYPNGFNISQNSACNGNVTCTITGGVTPYVYNWDPGNQTIASPSNLCGRENILEVTDNNGCKSKQTAILSEPPVASWTMTGNSGSNPSTEFLGTADNTDFVLKTNNNEAMRIKANGQLKIGSTSNISTSGLDLLFVDANGILQVGPHPCNASYNIPWTLGGNFLTGNANTDFIGTCNNYDFVMYTNANEVVRIKTSGNVGIGTSNPNQKLHVVGNSVFTQTSGSITSAAFIRGLNNNSTSSTPDYTWWGNDQTGIFHPASDVIAFSKAGSETMRIHSNGNVGIGTTNPNQKLHVVGNSVFTQTSGNINCAAFIRGLNNNSTSSTPDYTWWGNDQTGIFHPSGDVIAFSKSGNETMRIHSNGNVGIGNTSPQDRLQIGNGIAKVVFGNAGGASLNYGSYYMGFNSSRNGTNWLAETDNANNGASIIYSNVAGDLYFANIPSTGPTNHTFTDANVTSNYEVVKFQNDGKVGIGTAGSGISEKLQVDHGNILVRGLNNFSSSGNQATVFLGDNNNYIKSENGYGIKIGAYGATDAIRIYNDGTVGINIDPATQSYSSAHYKLLVGGKIGANEAWVSLGGPWPDYVFNNDYKLKSLDDVNSFVTKYKHLPEMPSAQDMKDAGGLNLGEIQTKTVKGMEEIYLHLFEMNTKIEQLSKENVQLKIQLQAMQNK